MTNPLTQCPTCGTKIKVTETVNGEQSIYRIRKCVPCKWIVVTEELPAEVQLIPNQYREAKRKGKR